MKRVKSIAAVLMAVALYVPKTWKRLTSTLRRWKS